MNHLPRHLRDIAREIQEEELDRAQRLFRMDPYMEGWCDCRDGKAHEDKGPDYTKGFRDRYEYEQEKSNGIR